MNSLFGSRSASARSKRTQRSQLVRGKRRAMLESLEDRRLLALLGIDPTGPPSLFANNTGSVSYDATTNRFSADATPLTFTNTPVLGFIFAPSSFDLQIEVDENGDLIGGVAGDDFVVTGSVDLDGDFIADVTGTLLTGEILEFGWFDSGAVLTDTFDFRFQVTGGALSAPGTIPLSGAPFPAYFDPAVSDIGMRIDSEGSTFGGDFNVNFGGGNKATFGPIDKLPQADPAELGNYVWVDTNYDGIQNDGDTGVNGVTVRLYQDLDGDGVAEPGGDDNGEVATTVTADFNGSPGFYLFPNLDPGDYFVVFDPTTIPAGFEFTTQNAGDDLLDSDADPISGIAEVTTLDAGESDLSWDAGIVEIVNPDIEIIKYVDKVVTTSTMHVIDFDELSAGDVVSTQYPGVTINAVNNRTGYQNAAMVFDSSNPTGGDADLGTPNQAFGGPGVGSGGGSNETALGNILIVSEDNDASDPDDEAQGGTFTFTFAEAVTINHLDLLDIDSDESGGSVVTVTTPTGQQTFAIPVAGNNSYQRLPIDVEDVTSLEVNFVSSGAITELKYTFTESQKQWFDANTPAEAVSFDVGETVEFSYHVTNPGDVSLIDVTLNDDNATPGDVLDDFTPLPVLLGNTGFNVGDLDQDNRLDPGEEWIYTAEITATEAGLFTNIGDVIGTPVNDDGDVIGDDVADNDPANYEVVGLPDVDIEKLTNGHQADLPSEAVEIAPGDDVTWTYIVTNTGTAPIAAADVVVVDDNGTPNDSSDDFNPAFVGPDAGNDGILSVGEVWEYTRTEPAQLLAGSGATSVFHFTGSSSVSGTAGNMRDFTVDGVSVNVSAFSRDANGNWDDAYLGLFSSGLGVTDGSESGSSGTHRVDNVGRDNYVLFEFSENIVPDRAFLDSVVGDSDLSIWIGNVPGAFTNHHALSDGFLSGLDLNQVSNTSSSSYRWANFNGGDVSGNVLVLAASTEDTTPDDKFKIRKLKFQQVISGIYGNVATVTADGAVDSDPSHYTNPEPEPPGVPNIDIEKLTNGVQADTAAEAVEIAPNDPVTWTYVVTNTGETTFTFAEVIVVDDNGTPNDPSDDFSPVFVGPDANNDGLLSPGEVWEYSESSTAAELTSTGATSTLYLSGNSGLDGSNGNIRSFNVDGVSVNASAFSRDSYGTWQTAFLGAFSSGLGVTDRSEGDGGNGTHRVDNIHRDNYVLFEFSEDVVVDKAFLDSVSGDSDLSVWVGSVPGAFANHQSLSDAFLSGLDLSEHNNTTSSYTRWADVNAGEVSGNVLVLAASTADTTPDDRFKIRKVKFQQLADGVYANLGSVEAGTVSDSDLSHYRNPVAAPSAKIGDYVWNDLDRDGIQDGNETGVSGVTVNLLDANGGQLQTTQTNVDGFYSFEGLDGGDYIVEFVAPTDFSFSPQGQGTASSGSDANTQTGRTGVIQLENHEVDLTIDAGIYEAAVDFMFEAEDFEWKDSPWQVYHSSSASGGKFIKAPNGTGSHYNSPPHGKKVMYRFNVDQAGNYEVSGLVKARNGSDNSVWIRIDDSPWIQWHMDTNYGFTWQNVTDGWHQEATGFNLTAGEHTMELKVREDGTKIDKFMFSKLASTTVVIDATGDISSASSAWQVEVDDDGNEFLIAASGNHYSAPPAGSEVTYDFTLDQAGQFKVHALVNAAHGGDNSFWIAIDDGEWVKWHLSVTDGQWVWQTVNEQGQEIQFDLSEGAHTLRIKVREDGTKLDKIVITNDANIDLSLIS